MCCAGELGITHFPNIPHSMLSGQTLTASNGCESALYQITSGSTMGKGPAPSLGSAGYSMPQNIVFAARLLELKAKI